MKSFLKHALTALAVTGLLSGTAALANPVTPVFTSFGTLTGATFGGSGIPNDAVAITTFGGVTLGLTATERFANPAVTDDGAGTFFAQPGSEVSPVGYAHWNFDFYAFNNTGTNYQLQLLWDVNPGVNTDQSSLLSLGTVAFNAGTKTQDSWNLGMGFANGGTFNPANAGQYSFALILKDQAGVELTRSAINVNVGTTNVPDAASTGLLSAFGLASLLVAGRLSRRKAVRA